MSLGNFRRPMRVIYGVTLHHIVHVLNFSSVIINHFMYDEQQQIGHM